MILADLKNPKQEIENLQLAVKYYLNSDSGILKTGRYPIYEDKIIAIVNSYQTQFSNEAIWESHRRYIDIQYMISGSEKMGYNDITNMKLKRPYKKEDDRILYEGEGKFIKVEEGQMVIFTPRDAHMPGLNLKEPSIVKKLILKVDVHFLDFFPDLIVDFARAYQN